MSLHPLGVAPTETNFTRKREISFLLRDHFLFLNL